MKIGNGQYEDPSTNDAELRQLNLLQHAGT